SPGEGGVHGSAQRHPARDAGEHAVDQRHGASAVRAVHVCNLLDPPSSRHRTTVQGCALSSVVGGQAVVKKQGMVGSDRAGLDTPRPTKAHPRGHPPPPRPTGPPALCHSTCPAERAASPHETAAWTGCHLLAQEKKNAASCYSCGVS